MTTQLIKRATLQGEKAKLPKGIAWICKKHKTFGDSFNINCAVCGYPKTPLAKQKGTNLPSKQEAVTNLEYKLEIIKGYNEEKLKLIETMKAMGQNDFYNQSTPRIKERLEVIDKILLNYLEVYVGRK